LLLMVLATVLVCGGCGDDDDGPLDEGTDGGTGCNLGEYGGDFTISEQSDGVTLAGYTSISGELRIECPSCADLSELICLTSVGGDLYICGNPALTNLDDLSAVTSVGGHLIVGDNNVLANLNGLSAITSTGGNLSIYENGALTDLDALSGITSVGENLWINQNGNLPDCEACELLAQLTVAPNQITVVDNLDDACTPVPANCP
jgi:hypothetical protein